MNCTRAGVILEPTAIFAQLAMASAMPSLSKTPVNPSLYAIICAIFPHGVRPGRQLPTCHKSGQWCSYQFSAETCCSSVLVSSMANCP